MYIFIIHFNPFHPFLDGIFREKENIQLMGFPHCRTPPSVGSSPVTSLDIPCRTRTSGARAVKKSWKEITTWKKLGKSEVSLWKPVTTPKRSEKLMKILKMMELSMSQLLFLGFDFSMCFVWGGLAPKYANISGNFTVLDCTWRFIAGQKKTVDFPASNVIPRYSQVVLSYFLGLPFQQHHGATKSEECAMVHHARWRSPGGETNCNPYRANQCCRFCDKSSGPWLTENWCNRIWQLCLRDGDAPQLWEVYRDRPSANLIFCLQMVVNLKLGDIRGRL